MRWLDRTTPKEAHIDAYCRQWQDRLLAGDTFQPPTLVHVTLDGHTYAATSTADAAALIGCTPRAVRHALERLPTACGPAWLTSPDGTDTDAFQHRTALINHDRAPHALPRRNTGAFTPTARPVDRHVAVSR